MLKVRDGLLINESQVVTAEFDQNNKDLKLTFVVPVTFALQEQYQNQVSFSGVEAEQLWDILSKDATEVRKSPYMGLPITVVGRHEELDEF
jgi:hypothetical protein